MVSVRPARRVSRLDFLEALYRAGSKKDALNRVGMSETRRVGRIIQGLKRDGYAGVQGNFLQVTDRGVDRLREEGRI